MTRASRKRFHYIYKTTCIVSGRYYIGMHSTQNLNDGYIGSGKRLWNSIRYHGREAHIREIIEHLPDRESLTRREKELITEEMLRDPMCMNLMKGGTGNWDAANTKVTPEQIQRRTSMGAKARNFMYWQTRETNPEKFSQMREKQLAGLRKAADDGRLGSFGMLGKKTSEETKAKLREGALGRAAGEKNGNYGSSWLSNPATGEIKLVQSTDILSLLSEGWIRGRKKMKNLIDTDIKLS